MTARSPERRFSSFRIELTYCAFELARVDTVRKAGVGINRNRLPAEASPSRLSRIPRRRLARRCARQGRAMSAGQLAGRFRYRGRCCGLTPEFSCGRFYSTIHNPTTWSRPSAATYVR
jgi:hypothetical protein